jgi:hypothetical protein
MLRLTLTCLLMLLVPLPPGLCICHFSLRQFAPPGLFTAASADDETPDDAMPDEHEHAPSCPCSAVRKLLCVDTMPLTPVVAGPALVVPFAAPSAAPAVLGPVARVDGRSAGPPLSIAFCALLI